MVFSSPIFLFGFLPVVLFLYYLSPKSIKNIVLLSMSLLFYAWGEVFYLGIMLVSIVSNFIIGKLIYAGLKQNFRYGSAKTYLSIGIAINIALLISFKYANFITDNINSILSVINVSAINLEPVHLPLGISFFTFQAISYIVDIYRKEVKPQRKLYNLALYISLFPQLIAGPIVRYHDIASQITDRKHSIDLFASGALRFVMGLSKKMLIANPLGEAADNIFALSGNDLTMPLAWIGVISYSLQIYFDFSGYSDMAIGLGRMFGFRFLENFNYPYTAKSLREFWRRWHISLSSWFRDYVYIALGGNRVSPVRVYSNLLIVFLLTGIWHGASWNFILWGLFHGVFLASEHRGFSKVLTNTATPVQHLYTLFVVLTSWVLFRSDNLTQAMDYYYSMLNFSNWNTTSFQYQQVLSGEFIYVFIAGIILSMPVYLWLKKTAIQYADDNKLMSVLLLSTPKVILLSSLLLLSILKVASSTYNPFIYFRF
ncbi:MAG: MBOAT family protein [Gammaproteobacteria bacterium]|nr:MBOAT family protein [Gammaproteobacteria bacterium]